MNMRKQKRKIDLNSVGIEEEIVTREMLGAEVMLYFEEQNRTHAVKLGPENKTRVGEKIQLFLIQTRFISLILKQVKIFYIGKGIKNEVRKKIEFAPYCYLVPSMLIFAVFILSF